MGHWIAIDGDDGFARAEPRKFLCDAALDDPQRIDHLVFQQIPLRFASVALLFGAPESRLLADAGDIKPQAWCLEDLFDIAQSVGPLIKFAAGHRTFDTAASAGAG